MRRTRTTSARMPIAPQTANRGRSGEAGARARSCPVPRSTVWTASTAIVTSCRNWFAGDGTRAEDHRAPTAMHGSHDALESILDVWPVDLALHAARNHEL